MPPFLQLPVTLRPGRIKQTLLLLLCSVFVVAGIFMVRKDGDVMGYVCIVFFGLGCGVFLVNFLPSAAYLRLEEDGFTFCSLFRVHTVRWADVLEFGVIRMRNNRMVAWNYVPSYTQSGAMRSVNQALSEFDAALPDTYGVKAMELAEEMQRLRDAYWMRHGLSLDTLNGTFDPQFSKAEPFG